MTSPRDPRDPRERPLPPHLDPRAPRPGVRPVPRTPLGPRTGVPEVVPVGVGRTRGQRVGRVLSWIALSTAVVVLLAAAGLYFAFNHYNGQIDRFNAFLNLNDKDRPAAAKNEATNFLLVGSDSRDGANGEGGLQGSGETFVTGQRSDTVILVHLFGSTNKAQLVSFPRDSYVEIPEFTNPETGKTRSAHFGKLNSAFSEGGAPLLTATIENLTQVRVDHFIQIDFTGFKGMVNALGGVDVCLTKPAKDSFSGINLTAGNHHITGDTALAFVRQRHGLANGDIDRIARQQQFIGSLANKVLSAGTLANPFKLNSFLNIATSSIKADTGLSGGDLKDFALRMKDFSSGGVIFTTVPIADISGRRGGASVVLLDEEKSAAMFTALRNDEAPGTPAKTAPVKTAPLIVTPANVRVSVFNGSGVQGLGRKAAADLAEVGFQVIGVPANRGSSFTQTTIYYGPTKADSARTLQAAIPGSVLQADSSLGRTLDLVVASSYDGAKSVTVTGTAKPTPPATSGSGTQTAAVPVKTAQDNPCTT